MSNRTMLEINHDYYPHGEREEKAWLVNMLAYLRSGNPRNLPDGVTWFGMRHHSEPCPMGKPPLGWMNDRPAHIHDVRQPTYSLTSNQRGGE